VLSVDCEGNHMVWYVVLGVLSLNATLGSQDELLQRLLDPDPSVRQRARDDWEETRLSPIRTLMHGTLDPSPVRQREGDDWEEAEARFAKVKEAVITGLIERLSSREEGVAEIAVDSLARLQIPQEEVFQAFFTLLEDNRVKVRRGALLGITNLHAMVSKKWYNGKIPALAGRLQDADPDVRRMALEAMADSCEASGWPNATAVEREYDNLVAATHDIDAGVRAEAASTLGRVPWRRTDDVVTPLRNCLKDRDFRVRRNAAYALRWIVRNAESSPAVPDLRRLFDDPNLAVRYAAAAAVWEIERDSTGLVPILIEALKTCEGTDLGGPARIVGEIGPEAAAAVPALVNVIDKIPPVRHVTSGSEAIDALGAIGPAAKEAIPMLREVEKNPVLGDRASYAIRRIQGH
jgi:HEAT repeat protein